MAYADINGQLIYYEDTQGSGSPVLFSHGLFMDHEMWAPQLECLRDHYRCVTWDQRCWGQTETTDDPFDYWDLAGDALALLDHLGIARAVLVGMSQGGFLSLRAAITEPRRVLALVLVDTDPFAEDTERRRLYDAMFDQALAGGITDPLAQAITALLFGPNYDAGYWVGKMRAKAPRLVSRAIECLLTRDDISSQLDKINCPTLVVHGELDAAFPVDQAHRWANTLPALTEFVRVPDAGHTSCLENPSVVNAALEQFLRR